MTKSDKTADGLVKHDMPLMHFWQAFGGTMMKHNALLADYAGRRMDDNNKTLLAISKSGDPVAAAASITDYWLRVGSDTSALMFDLLSGQREISEEVADLVEEEKQLSGKKSEEVFENAPV